ncbi:MAG TPA: Fe-S cluster assembly protein SufD [Acidimicrobiia bacterium]
MESAFAVFSSLEEPTGAEEDWRYVEYDLPFSNLSPVGEPGAPMAPGPFVGAISSTSGRALIVDGSVVEADSDTVVVRRLADIEPDRLASRVPAGHNKLAAAHAAFAHDGLFIDVPAGASVAEPFLIDLQAVTAHTASFPHISVRVGDSAEAGVIVVYRSSPGASLLMVPEIHLELGQGANLRFLSLQNMDHAGTSVTHERVVVGRDATARIGEVGLGGDFARLDLGMDLEGDGSSAETVGLYFGEGSQTLDYRLVVRHSGKHTTSDVFLKGAVGDEAQSVFTGLLRIEKEAVGTNTFETNRNLVLSDGAKANSVPNLEILCDDVVCGHGSSVGPPDEESLYYLQSRGLPRPTAERLLIRGFFQEVIDRLPIGGMEEPIAAEVFRRFVAGQSSEGRVA